MQTETVPTSILFDVGPRRLLTVHISTSVSFVTGQLHWAALNTRDWLNTGPPSCWDIVLIVSCDVVLTRLFAELLDITSRV